MPRSLLAVAPVISPTVFIAIAAVLVVAGLVALAMEKSRRQAAPLLLVVAILAGAAAVVLWFMPARASTPESGLPPPPATPAQWHVVSNLKQIALVTIMYADDHRKQLPPDFGATFSYLQAGSVYVVPDSGTTPPTSAAEVNAGQTDVVYVGAGKKLPEQDREKILVAATSPDVFAKQGFVCTVYLDCHSEVHLSVPPNVEKAWLEWRRAAADAAKAAADTGR
jgi:hypothetical protein